MFVFSYDFFILKIVYNIVLIRANKANTYSIKIFRNNPIRLYCKRVKPLGYSILPV